MNCTHTTRLLPLFIGGDLSAQQTGSVRAHLFACQRCGELAAEYEATATWLDCASKPDLDEKFFESLHEAVWRGIRSDVTTASRWSPWSWGFAAAIVLLLACGAFFVTRRGQTTSTSMEVAVLTPGPDSRDVPVSLGQKEPRSSISSVRRPHRPSAIRRGTTAARSIQESMIVETTSQPGEPKEALSESNVAAVQPVTRRIEIQTADPSIRIIWLIPEKVLADQPQTATDD